MASKLIKFVNRVFVLPVDNGGYCIPDNPHEGSES